MKCRIQIVRQYPSKSRRGRHQDAMVPFHRHHRRYKCKLINLRICLDAREEKTMWNQITKVIFSVQMRSHSTHRDIHRYHLGDIGINIPVIKKDSNNSEKLKNLETFR